MEGLSRRTISSGLRRICVIIGATLTLCVAGLAGVAIANANVSLSGTVVTEETETPPPAPVRPIKPTCKRLPGQPYECYQP